MSKPLAVVLLCLLLGGSAFLLFGKEQGGHPPASGQEGSTDIPAKVPAAAQPDQNQPIRAPAREHSGRTVAEPSRTSWKEDPELFNAIVATFNATFDEKVAFSSLDAEKKLIGDLALKRSIGISGATTSSIQVRIEDFDGLPQDQKLVVADLLQRQAMMSEERGSSIPEANDPLEAQIFNEKLRTKSLYAAPDHLIQALGLTDKMEDPAFSAEVRRIRAEILREAAPIATDLDYRRRFALGAAMANGVGPTEFNFMTESHLIAPRISELEAEEEALSIEFWIRLKALGERF